MATVSRKHDDHNIDEVVEELERRGLRVRVTAGRGGVEDFCFLVSTLKELVSTSKSTFAIWAT